MLGHVREKPASKPAACTAFQSGLMSATRRHPLAVRGCETWPLTALGDGREGGVPILEETKAPVLPSTRVTRVTIVTSLFRWWRACIRPRFDDLFHRDGQRKLVALRLGAV